VAADWVEAPVAVQHTFTHFHLTLRVLAARVPLAAAPLRGTFLGPDAFSPASLPTLMRKAFDAALPALDSVEAGGPSA
jgi:A/G-specific adenine glycosylase